MEPEPVVIKKQPKLTEQLVPLAAMGVFIIFLLSLFGLNYYSLLPISKLVPQLSFLPTLENKPMITIGDQEITKREYDKVLDEVQQFLNDRKISIERTNELFAANLLLKKEAQSEGYPFSEETFKIYLAQNEKNINNLTISERLEQENAFLRELLINNSLAWYSGQFFLVRFENQSLNISDEEKKSRARAKIEEIRNKLAGGVSIKDVVTSYTNDEELNILNDGQSFAGFFEKMSLSRPTLSSPEILAAIPLLDIGQVSEVITMSDPKRANVQTPVPFAYSIIVLTQKQPGLADSYQEWFENAKTQNSVQILAK